MGSDQDDWLRRNTLTASEIAIRKDRERRLLSRKRIAEHAIYGGPFKSKPITVASIAAAGASIDAVPAMPQREAMGAAAAAAIDDKVRELLAQAAGVRLNDFTEFLDKHYFGTGSDPDFHVKSPAPAAPSDLPTDPELRALVLQIRELAKD